MYRMDDFCLNAGYYSVTKKIIYTKAAMYFFSDFGACRKALRIGGKESGNIH